jgi:hypothetical protein
MTARVEYADEEPNGIARLIGGLIEGNLQDHPERERLLRPAAVGIVADDAGVGITLRIRPGLVVVANGIMGNPDVLVRTDSITLTELASAPLRFGFPDAMRADGRAITRKLTNGKLKVKGLSSHPGIVSRLNRLLSVR